MHNIFKRYLHRKDGQFGLWMGIAACPLLLTVSLAVDFNSAERTRSQLKSALDNAALAAVTHQALTTSEREAYARSYFNQNFPRSKMFELSVGRADEERVELSASGYSAVTIGRAAGIDGLQVFESSTAVLTKENIICVLTLNPDGEESFLVTDGSLFSAPSCSVQVNSNHVHAASVDVLSKATAKSFCAVGGVEGAFWPFANTECSSVDDPYAGLVPPTPGPCIFDGKLEFKVDQVINQDKYGAAIEDEIVAIVGDNITLKPGTYCEKVKVEGYNVTFLPGIYIMSNAELEFKQGASATAIDVTFVLQGKKSKVKVESGASLYVKAPDSGRYAGLAFYQDPAAAIVDKKGKVDKDPEFPTAKSELKGGASMSILGTVYLPTQELKVGSDSGLGTQAPATSFIAYNVAFEGGSKIDIAVDHIAAGLPPLLPRSDEGARLIE